MDHRSGLRLSLGGLLGSLVSGLACAATTLSAFPPNPGVLPGGGWVFTPGTTFGNPVGPRAWVNGVYGGVPGVKATDAIKVLGPAGDMTVGVATSATARAVGAAAARCLLLLNPYCAAGAAVAVAYQTLRVKPDAGGLGFDEGQGKQVAGLWSAAGGFFNTPTAAYDAFSASYFAGVVVGNDVYKVLEGAGQCQVTSATTASCSGKSVVVKRKEDNGVAYTVPIIAGQLNLVQSQQCPAVVDYYDPRYSVPGGPAGSDGKCPTGHYSNITEDQAAAKFAAYPPADVSSIAQDVVKSGQQIVAEPAGVTGPASQTGTPVTTTTTNPNGTSNTTTKTPSYQFQYSNDRFTYLSVATTINNNAGDVTTTTTTTTPPGPTQDPEDPCVKNPETIGCKKLDTPEDVALQTKDIPVVFQPDSGWGSGDAACPAPHVVTIQGQQITMDNTLICGFMSGIRFAVIGVAGLVAAFIFIGGIKE